MWKLIITNLLVLLCFATVAKAQKECPEEWQAYTTDKYFSSLQPAENEDFKPEADFLNNLETQAVNRLAKSVKVAVHNLMSNQVYNVDEDGVVNYFERFRKNADVGMSFIEKKQYYNNYTHHGCVIAYIEKSKASAYYCNEIRLSQEKLRLAIANADKFIAANRTDSARFELEAAVPELSKDANALFLLKVFNCAQDSIDILREKHNSMQQEVKEKFQAIGPKQRVAIDCNADLFGTSYWALSEGVKDWLATRGIGFTNDKSKADWVLTIKSSARKYNTMSNGTQTTYYSYVDAEVSLNKVADSKSVYSQKHSIKGAFTKNYEEAAKVGYNELLVRVLNALEENLK